MKNYTTLLFGVLLMLSSCNNTQSVTQTVETKIGIEIADDGTKLPLTAGDLSTIEVWENYIKAHNERDFETIRELNFENIRVWGPKGEYVDGTDAHIEFLTQWFNDNSPKWDTNYLIANELTNQDGERRQWVTSSSDIILTVEGQEVKAVQVYDALISDGKVQMFFVYERVKQDNENIN